MRIKAFVAVLLALTILLCLCACNGDGGIVSNDGTVFTTTTTTTESTTTTATSITTTTTTEAITTTTTTAKPMPTKEATTAKKPTTTKAPTTTTTTKAITTTAPPATETVTTKPNHIHQYTSKTTNPSCTESGYTTYTCSCGDSHIADQTKATGHNYSKKVTAPNCTDKGYTTYTCTICGNSYTNNKTNATGHSWGSWKVTKEPTATVEGTEQRTCKACGMTESRNIEKLAYESFAHKIGNYNAHTLAYKDWKGDTEQAAFIEVYSLTKTDEVLEGLTAEFERVYGFAPNLGDKYQRCTTACEKVGTYIVDGYAEPQTVYHYTITDKTYIYITNEMYKVYVQQCDDGSVWVGYCIYATMDTVDTERNKPEVRKLHQEMYATFEKLIVLSLDEMYSYIDTLDLKIGYISQAGTVRSANAEGLVNVLYIYCRGFAV